MTDPHAHGRSTLPASDGPYTPIVLEEAACWALLDAEPVGRLAACVDGRPLIRPVSFVVDGRTVVIRTADGTKLSAARQRIVAFEVDHYDPTSRIASSVIVVGRARTATDADDWESMQVLPLFPWQTGPKPHFLRIVPETISGLSFRAAYAGA